MGLPSYAFIDSDFQGTTGSTVMPAMGTYFVPLFLRAETSIENAYIYCTGASDAKQVYTQLYSSQNGKPKTPLGDSQSTSISSTGLKAIGVGGAALTLKAGLYFFAVCFTTGASSNTYTTVTQSASSGGPNYLGWGTTDSSYATLNYKPRPGLYSMTQYNGSSTLWATSPAVESGGIAVAPVVRFQTSIAATNLESGLA
jgi:hypothetical protein